VALFTKFLAYAQGDSRKSDKIQGAKWLPKTGTPVAINVSCRGYTGDHRRQ
jgi:hypothetical protein